VFSSWTSPNENGQWIQAIADSGTHAVEPSGSLATALALTRTKAGGRTPENRGHGACKRTQLLGVEIDF